MTFKNVLFCAFMIFAFSICAYCSPIIADTVQDANEIYSDEIDASTAISLLSSESGQCGKSLTYEITENEVVISGSGKMNDYYFEHTPWYGKESYVLRIKSGVSYIGKESFVNAGIAVVFIPRTVKSIGEYAFNLSSVGFVCYEGSESEWNKISIGEYNTALDNIIFNVGESSVFYSGSCGEKVTFNVSADGKISFEGTGYINANPEYHSLSCFITDVSYSDGIKNTGENAFSSFASLDSVSFGNDIESIDSYAFSECKISKLVLPESVRVIGEGAFSEANIGEIVLNDGLEVIGIYAFSKCRVLDVVIPETVKEIGYWAFERSLINSVTVPDSTEFLGKEAFYMCSQLTSAKLGDGLEVVPSKAFYGCTKLKSVTLGRYIEEISNEAFYGCTKLKNIKICKGYLSVISPYAFYECSDLKELVLPPSVSHIGYNAFDESGLEKILYLGTAEQFDSTLVGRDNDPFINATVVYNFKYPTGDANGDLSRDMRDVVFLAQYCAGWEYARDFLEEESSDVNGDGNLNIMDVIKLAQFCAGWFEEF